MARMAIYPFGRAGRLANVYRVPRSSAAIDLANSWLFQEPLIPIGATLSATLSGATLAASGSGSASPINGTLSSTLGSALLSATGALRVSASASVTFGAATLASSGTLRIAGSASVTFGAATLAATGAVRIAGSTAISLGSATLAATGALRIAGSVTATLSAATLAANGNIVSTPIGGEATATLDDATLSAVATLTTQRLSGRKPRGRKVVFEDELPAPVFVPAPVIEPLPSLATARAAIVDARAALEAVKIARIEAQERKERQRAIDSLSVELSAAQARYNAAREAEARIVRRLRDEDELFLLAA